MGRVVVNVDVVVVVVVDRNEWDISNEQQNRRFQVGFGENSRDHGSQCRWHVSHRTNSAYNQQNGLALVLRVSSMKRESASTPLL
jgi:hypothetical protein